MNVFSVSCISIHLRSLLRWTWPWHNCNGNLTCTWFTGTYRKYIYILIWAGASCCFSIYSHRLFSFVGESPNFLLQFKILYRECKMSMERHFCVLQAGGLLYRCRIIGKWIVDIYVECTVFCRSFVGQISKFLLNIIISHEWMYLEHHLLLL